MNRFPSDSLVRLLLLMAAICLLASVLLAQEQGAAAGAGDAAGQIPGGQLAKPDAVGNKPSQDGNKANPENEWLAKTAKLYYSSAKAGLAGFDCQIHPDWHTLFASAGNGQAVADDDPRIALLKSVKITMHARMKGGSTIEWVADSDPDKPLDQSSTEMLDAMHRSIEETLEGFLQFWSPFMEVSVVPDSGEGLEITHTPTVHTIRASQSGTELTEVFSSKLVLEQFNVNMNGTSIKFLPIYTATPQGLLVNAFEAHILPAGATAGQEQAMKIDIEYQPVDGLTIPARLKMNVVGTGQFDYAFDGCATNPK
jgi:hypothetical protein